jgi:hypothetical protein
MTTSNNQQPVKKKKVRDPPQIAIESFWGRFLAKEPSRATLIFPEALYNTLLPTHTSPDGTSSSCNAAESYEAAAQECRERVARIVKECKRTNEKFTDTEFDICEDFTHTTRNCLEGLKREKEKKASSATSEDDEVENEPMGPNSMQPDSPEPQPQASSATKPGSVRRVPWIFKKPQFTVGGFSGTAFKQGRAGNCWWLAATSTLCSVEGVMERICVARDDKCGVYGFVFFRDGEWISTVIDDYLYLKEKNWTSYYDPRHIEGQKYRERFQTGSDALYFSKSDDPNETWMPLLEKAYAKIHGDYQAIDGGWMGEAVEDMTGGVTTVIRCADILDPDELWKDMVDTSKSFLFSLCSRSSGNDEEPWRHGIPYLHAHSVLRSVEETGEDGEVVRLVKIRNPWGKRDYKGGGEWDGFWSDGSDKW